MDEPVNQEVETTVVLVPSVQNEKLGKDTNVGQNNVPVLVLLENGRSWVEVVHAPTGWGNLLTSDVSRDVHDPTEQLLGNQGPQGNDRRVRGNLLNDRGTSVLDELISGLRNENHISVHVASSLVVLRVRELPGEVWNEPERVQHPTNSVVDDSGVRESRVATLVGQNPDTSTEKTLDDGICGPSSESKCSVGQYWNVSVGNPSNGNHGSDVTENIVHGLESTTLVTLGRNDRQNVLNGVVWSLELVSVSVNCSQFLQERGDVTRTLGGFGGQGSCASGGQRGDF